MWAAENTCLSLTHHQIGFCRGVCRVVLRQLGLTNPSAGGRLTARWSWQVSCHVLCVGVSVSFSCGLNSVTVHRAYGIQFLSELCLFSRSCFLSVFVCFGQDDTDLAGPLVFCLCFGLCLLLTGKVRHALHQHALCVQQGKLAKEETLKKTTLTEQHPLVYTVCML